MVESEPVETENEATQLQDPEEKSPKDFDDVLAKVGSQGKYQKLLLYGFITPFTVVEPMVTLNTIFMLSEPDHWCAPPNDTISVDLWKNTSIPRIPGNVADELVYSSCSMFNETMDAVPCAHGWQYDRSLYDSTIPTDFNWVCDDGHHVTDAFTAAALGNAVGAILFGQAADIFGRKPIFFATVIVNVLFRILSFYIIHSPYLFHAMQFLVGTAYPVMFIAPCLIVAEMCDPDYRAWIYALTWMTWVIGMSFLPFLAWLCRSWYVIGWVTSMSAVVLLLYIPIVPESPRWLLLQGKTEAATKVVVKLAKTNKAKVSESKIRGMMESLALNLRSKKQDKVNVWTLFSRRRLATKTILLTVCWFVNVVVYYAITLNTTKMAGNEFLNFFILSIIELPAGYFGGKLADSLGRRWTQAAFMGACAAALLAAGVVISFPHPDFVVTTLVLIAKFAITLTFLVVYIQGTELFPTNLRSTGTGFASLVASIVGIGGPSIVAMGKYHRGIPYFATMFLSLLGMVAAACLPETYNQNLPETIEDADNFGKGVPFWSFKPKSGNDVKPEPESKPMQPL